MLCFRLLHTADPATPLADAVASLRDGHTPRDIYAVDPASFRQIPNAPFAYWVSERVRRIFTELPAMEGEGRTVKQGLATADDFRFARTSWETPSETSGGTWFPFAKGGSFSPFYADIYLKVNWASGGREMAAFAGSAIRNPTFYFRPGLTWPLRTQVGLGMRAFPPGSIFGHKGPSAFVESDDPEALCSLLAITTSEPFRGLVEIQMAFGSYEVGVIQRTVLPRETDSDLARLALEAWTAKRRTDTANLTSHAFSAPALLRGHGALAEGIAAWSALLAETFLTLSAIQSRIDEVAYRLYGIGDDDRRAIGEMLSVKPGNGKSDEEDEEAPASANAPSLVSELLDYALGCAFGRWDIRYATGERPAPPVPEPFAPLPICPPGMLQNTDGLPAATSDVSARYPVRITWPGLLVDDPAHPEDIERRVSEILAVLFPGRADAIANEACALLGVKSLREWFRKPVGFFADHLKRYSKSRRQAPIYWPLSTASGRYTLWIYYHRLTDQTLFQCVTDFIKPKIVEVESDLARLRTDEGQRTQIDEMVELLAELTGFRDELLRIAALPWKPNLNDGVLITASPLWKLFRLPKWQKDLKACWQELEKGEYDWSHLAYTIWPDRVKRACETDRSLAIAHGLEDLCKVEAPKAKGKRGKKKADAELLEEQKE